MEIKIIEIRLSCIVKPLFNLISFKDFLTKDKLANTMSNLFFEEINMKDESKICLKKST